MPGRSSFPYLRVCLTSFIFTGAVSTLYGGPTWTQQQELTASNAAMNDDLGFSVSVSGNTAVIGASGIDDGKGGAYVFVRNGGVWTQQQELTASDGVPLDQFGTSVSVSGNTAVIGAPYNSGQGAAYVFVQNNGVWTQQQKLTGPAGTRFGFSVSVSGDTTVIGSGPGVPVVAYVFVRSGGVWSEQQKLSSFNFALSPPSVAVSGDTAVVGADPGGALPGSASVFVRSGGVWTLQQTLAASDGVAGNGFGIAVAVSGNTAVIGTVVATGGSAYVFVNSGGFWSQRQKLTASGPTVDAFFGSAVSVDGNTMVIGASGGLSGVPGQAYLFVDSNGVWKQQQTLTASDGAANDAFGVAVAVSAGTVVVGAPWIHSNNGAAYVFVPSQLYITTDYLPSGVVGVTYSQMLTAAGGTPPYTWQTTSGRLPAVLMLNPSTGQISGTPTFAAAPESFEFQVTDSTAPVPQTAAVTLTMAILSSSSGGVTRDPVVCPQGNTLLTGYAMNPASGDSFINLTNDGASEVGGASGNLCVNIYAFDPAEEMLSCCTCVITPNGIVSLSINDSLLSNTIDGERPASAVVALVTTPGLHAWATSLRGSAKSGYAITERAFSPGSLSPAELNHLTSYCAFIQGNGSGQGICPGCSPAGL